MTKLTIFSTLWRPANFMTTEQRYSTDLLVISHESYHPDFNPTGATPAVYQDGYDDILRSSEDIPEYKRAEWLRCIDHAGGAFLGQVWCNSCEVWHTEPLVPLRYLIMGAPNEIIRTLSEAWVAREEEKNRQAERAASVQNTSVLSFDTVEELTDFMLRDTAKKKPFSH